MLRETIYRVMLQEAIISQSWNVRLPLSYFEMITGSSRKKIRPAIKSLEESGMISTIQDRECNVYIINTTQGY